MRAHVLASAALAVLREAWRQVGPHSTPHAPLAPCHTEVGIKGAAGGRAVLPGSADPPTCCSACRCMATSLAWGEPASGAGSGTPLAWGGLWARGGPPAPTPPAPLTLAPPGAPSPLPLPWGPLLPAVQPTAPPPAAEAPAPTAPTSAPPFTPAAPPAPAPPCAPVPLPAAAPPAGGVGAPDPPVMRARLRCHVRRSCAPHAGSSRPPSSSRASTSHTARAWLWTLRAWGAPWGGVVVGLFVSTGRALWVGLPHRDRVGSPCCAPGWGRAVECTFFVGLNLWKMPTSELQID